MRYESIGDLEPARWDQQCLDLGVTSPWHSWSMLNYYAKSCNGENRSFLLINDQGDCIAVCPLIVSKEPHGLDSLNTVSIGGASVPSPLISRFSDENRIRRNLRMLEEILDEICVKNSVDCARYVYRGYSYFSNRISLLETAGIFDLLAAGFAPVICQSVVIDLRKEVSALEAELSKFHRKEIRKAAAEGQVISVIDSHSSLEDLRSHFSEYQAAHTAAAGRQTRPQSSFDAMEAMIAGGEADLFVNRLGRVPISYLYCGRRNGVTYGWSQANVSSAHVTSPRHFLEWGAILHYAKNSASLYDVGPKYYEGQLGARPSEKQKTISFYKERFGGVLVPEIHYRKFYNKSLMQKEYCSDLSAFIDHPSLSSVIGSDANQG